MNRGTAVGGMFLALMAGCFVGVAVGHYSRPSPAQLRDDAVAYSQRISQQVADCKQTTRNVMFKLDACEATLRGLGAKAPHAD